MGELRIFYHQDKRIRVSRSLDELNTINLDNLIWIDLNNVDEEVENRLEQFLKIYIQEDEEMEEIEMSSRYIQTDDGIVANSSFLREDFIAEPVSFILKKNILVSVRNNSLKSFNETMKKLYANSSNFPSGYHVLVSLLETRVEYDADLLEDILDQITGLGKQLNANSSLNQNILIDIKDMQEKVMIVRQNIVDKHRVVSNMLKSSLFPPDLFPRLTMIIKDINSLLEYTRFGFDRLDYFQDTFLGLVNLQQNNIIKIFTVVSVIFMPPTLIASIYGMNFMHMPEIRWSYGYPFSIGLMLVFSGLVLLFFRKKKWL